MANQSRPNHHHIDLPRGFYAMLCHPNGSPDSEWDRMARIIAAAPDMRQHLQYVIDNYARDHQGLTDGQWPFLRDIRALLARIDNTEGAQS